MRAKNVTGRIKMYHPGRLDLVFQGCGRRFEQGRKVIATIVASFVLGCKQRAAPLTIEVAPSDNDRVRAMDRIVGRLLSGCSEEESWPNDTEEWAENVGVGLHAEDVALVKMPGYRCQEWSH